MHKLKEVVFFYQKLLKKKPFNQKQPSYNCFLKKDTVVISSFDIFISRIFFISIFFIRIIRRKYYAIKNTSIFYPFFYVITVFTILKAKSINITDRQKQWQLSLDIFIIKIRVNSTVKRLYFGFYIYFILDWFTIIFFTNTVKRHH